MQATALILHNLLRWAVLLMGIWTILNAITGITTKRSYSANDNRSNLLFMIFCDVQFLFGLVLFFTGPWIEKIKAGMGPLMKNTTDRFFVVEHALMMILAYVLVHIGRVAVKKAAPESKHKKMLLFFGIALLLIIVSIPWPNKGEVARPLMRWFN
jgi:hypothetical protein